MKRIINRKMYNTETAKLVDTAASGTADSFDSYYWIENL